MLLSPDQVKSFWRLWSKACKAQNWTTAAGLHALEIDAKRKDFLRSCGFESLTRVDRVDGFTKVKNELLVLMGESIQAGMESEDSLINKARTLRHYILNELAPCLAVYLVDDEPALRRDAADRYVVSIVTDLACWNKLDRPGREVSLEDLDAKPILKQKRDGSTYEAPSLLNQVIMTLSARIQARRKESGDTVHHMKLKAGIRCTCERFCNGGTIQYSTMSVDQVLGVKNEPVKDAENEPW